ncbi:MAG: hypothetical protein OZ921_21025 [Sorangiineae bacterium]|nr:hypothetical protein [Polyangiaceae bacterium]MEB2325011.1 hypothetical protein [Sorangiineae bacterium]
MRARVVLCLSALLASLYGCGGAAPASPPRAASQPAPATPRAVTELARAEVVAAVDAGLGRFLQHVELEPVLVGGKFEGFRVVTLRPPEFWDGVDVRPGDVVTQVNGQPIERETQAYDAFQALKTARALEVSLTRDGKPRTLVLPIVGAPPASATAPAPPPAPAKSEPGSSALVGASPLLLAAGNGARSLPR